MAQPSAPKITSQALARPCHLIMKPRAHEIDPCTQFWIDYRLAYDGRCVNLGSAESLAFDGDIQNEIWTPDAISPTSAKPIVVMSNGFWIAPTGRECGGPGEPRGR